jgi:hypothetical protein
MERKKLDLSLQRALDISRNPGEDRFSVFIETSLPVSGEEQQFLEGMGMRNVRAGNTVFPASLTGTLIGTLSDQPWISRIRLATRMKYL